MSNNSPGKCYQENKKKTTKNPGKDMKTFLKKKKK